MAWGQQQTSFAPAMAQQGGSQGPTTPYFAQPSNSLFSQTQSGQSNTQPTYSSTPNSFCTKPPVFNPSQQTSLSTQPSNFQINSQVQSIMERLNNADLRSCQILVDTFNSLETLTNKPPLFITFTFNAAQNPQDAQMKRSQLEQEIANMNNIHVTEAYKKAKSKVTDPNKYYIVPINGLKEAINHTKQQKVHLDQIKNKLLEMENQQEIIQNHLQARSFKRYHDILKRQHEMHLNVMRTVGIVEEFALKHSIAQIDIPFLKKVQNDLVVYIDEFQASPAGNVSLTNTLSDLTRILKSAIGSNIELDDVDIPLSSYLNAFIKKRKEESRKNECVISSYDLELIKKMISRVEMLFEPFDMSIQCYSAKIKKIAELKSTSEENLQDH